MSRIPRFHISQPFHYKLNLSVQQYHHIRNVLRLSSGSMIHVFNHIWGEWCALWRGNCELEMIESRRAPCDKSYGIVCFFSLCKRYRDIIEKATEIGVDALYPCLTVRSMHGNISVTRMQDIAVHAVEQSGQLAIPVIHNPMKINQAIEQFNGTLWQLDQQGGHGISLQSAQPWGVLIGPEGGWDASEKNLGHPWSLGDNILRSETAALVALSRLHEWRTG